MSELIFSQKIIRTIDGDYFELLFDRNFIFQENCYGCGIGCRHGEGIYSKSKNKFELKFSQTPTTIEKYFIQYDSIASDSIFTIKISVYEDSIYKLMGANVYLQKGKKIYGTMTDINGNASISVTKNTEFDTLIISFIGYASLKINIKHKNQFIAAYLVNIDFFKIYSEQRAYLRKKFKRKWYRILY